MSASVLGFGLVPRQEETRDAHDKQQDDEPVRIVHAGSYRSRSGTRLILAPSAFSRSSMRS
jgi:hypothetical protein